MGSIIRNTDLIIIMFTILMDSFSVIYWLQMQGCKLKLTLVEYLIWLPHLKRASTIGLDLQLLECVQFGKEYTCADWPDHIMNRKNQLCMLLCRDAKRQETMVSLHLSFMHMQHGQHGIQNPASIVDHSWLQGGTCHSMDTLVFHQQINVLIFLFMTGYILFE